MTKVLLKCSKQKPDVPAISVIRCPKCKRTLLEADAHKIVMRCPKCRYWVFMEKPLTNH